MRKVVGGGVRFDAYTRHLFSRDASMYAIEPIGVVFPRDGSEAAAVVATAAEFGVPVLARGAGTSLAGQTVGRAVVMDFSRHMSKVLAIDAEARRARVQPGVVQEQLNLAAARHGLMFGPDVSTSDRATLGGMIGNNSAGGESVRYGKTVDHVLALDVVLSDEHGGLRAADGAPNSPPAAARATLGARSTAGLPALAARNARRSPPGSPGSGAGPADTDSTGWPARGGPGGLDLARLMVGSEGTLVTVVAAEVALVPVPRHLGHRRRPLHLPEAALEARRTRSPAGPSPSRCSTG